MPHILFLDDAQKRWDAAKPKIKKVVGVKARFVQTAAACIAALTEQPWDVVFLDHDLSKTDIDSRMKNTGAEVVRHLILWPLHWAHKLPSRIVVHSHNETGVRYMTGALRCLDCSIVVARFGSKDFSRLLDGLPLYCLGLR